MIKRKFENVYRVLCLVIVAVVCVMLTGAGQGNGGLDKNLDESIDKSRTNVVINKNEIRLENLIPQNCILRINYDLEQKSKEKLGIINDYTGDNKLLGTKLNKSVFLISSNAKTDEWFPTLCFDAYDWFDEEKDIGIISLVLTQESKLDFTQLQDTTLYEQLPVYAINNLKYRDSRSVQNTEIYTTYSLQRPIEGLKSMVELTEQIKMVRTIDVIIPEII